MKLTKEQMDNMIGIAGPDTSTNKIPKLSINGVLRQGTFGQRRGIPGTNKYVGVNHGERWNEDHWRQIVNYAGKSMIDRSKPKQAKVEKLDEQDS